MGSSPDAICAATEGGGLAVDSNPPFVAAARDLVLLVEDDDSVAGLIERIVAPLLLRIVRVSTGREAEFVLAERSAEVALAIVDFGLPDMDGRSLCPRLRRLLPGLPVLFTSGSEGLGERGLIGPTAFLPKPFFPAQVRQQVRALLGTIA